MCWTLERGSRIGTDTMTFPTKMRGYRLVTIGEELYRWRFTADHDSGWLTVLKESGTMSSLIVSLPEFREFWIHFPKWSKDTPLLRMTPALVVIITQEALELGWTPTRVGPPFHCLRLANSTLYELHSLNADHKTSIT